MLMGVNCPHQRTGFKEIKTHLPGSPVSQPLVSERVARLRPDVMTRERMTCTEHPGILAALVHGASHEGTRCVGARDIQRQG
jgi:hypothetical protein